ncbi:MAG: hypothetical protein IPI19_16625 [Ignavibacteriales bacterium]|nr:hypothetical protein [Ignavibacteriales bacterium]
MKKKKSKKLSQENPNQLSLEFLFKETAIDVLCFPNPQQQFLIHTLQQLKDWLYN